VGRQEVGGATPEADVPDRAEAHAWQRNRPDMLLRPRLGSLDLVLPARPPACS
jgi:hypothetical protein